jgi:hypothetical protein
VGGINMKYALDRPTLLSLWLVQEGTNLTQIEVVALKEIGFLLSKKPKCPLINLVGDNIFALVNQPPRCAPWNLLGDGICTLSISHWIQMLGQNQRMGKRFIVLTLSSYPFCKKISERWDKLLKPHD